MADEAEFDQITDEEKLQIAQHYLLSSPPGQFNEVLTDVRKIVSESVLADSVTAGIARVSNVKSNKIVTRAKWRKGTAAVLTSAAEIDASHYFDPHSRTTFSVDHLTLATQSDEVEYPADESLESLRSEIQLRAESYVKTAYNPTEQHAVGVYARNGVITIVVSGEKTNLKNFWSGRWSSQWTLNKATDVFSGEIKIHVHYFEDGNLQMQTTKAIPANTLTGTSDSDLAAKVVARIQAEENALQGGLDEMYNNMNNETIRSMRRVMPITKSKMDWNVNAVRMVRQVRK